MVEKEDIRQHVEASLEAFNRAGAALHRAQASVETLEPEAALEDLAECSELLATADDEVQEGLAWAEKGLETGLIRSAYEELADEHTSPFEHGDRIFGNLRRQGELDDVFLSDDEAWNHLQEAGITGNPFAGYERYASFLTRVRDHVDGLARDVENGVDEERLRTSMWRASVAYMRTKNLLQMLEFINRETR
ncbi:hypothetical protein BRC81_01180 [Halobacteriales archaeon QS_1_68_20]|nr:MAG: hypothetical protein BRC81_01180 [Halobacteriales archaeon QS_1_68_20]